MRQNNYKQRRSIKIFEFTYTTHARNIMIRVLSVEYLTLGFGSRSQNPEKYAHNVFFTKKVPVHEYTLYSTQVGGFVVLCCIDAAI